MAKLATLPEQMLGLRQRRRFLQLALIAAVAVGTVALAARGYRAIDHDLTSAALSRRDSVAYLAAATLTEKFDRLVDVAVSLATRVRFSELVAEQRWDEAILILSSIPQDFPFIDRAVVSDPSGTVMAGVPAVVVARGENFAHRDWYRGVSANWSPYLSNVYARAGQPPANVLGVSAPIKSEGRVVGILLLQVRIDRFFTWVYDIEFDERGFIYVVDRNGIVAAHPAIPPEGMLTDFATVPAVQKALHGERSVETQFDPKLGEERLVAYAPTAKYGWAVVAEQPASVAFARKRELLTGMAAGYLLILLLFGGVALLLSRVAVEREHSKVARRARDELERRVAERTAELEAANRELESFSYSVSHDLRTPLRVIDGFSRLLEDDYGDRLDAEAHRRISIVRHNVAGMTQLIEDLLEFSHTGRKPIVAADIDMTALAQEALDDLTAALNPKPLAVVNPMPAARGDAGLIRQAWSNLLANAIKFSSKSPAPTIEVGGQAHGHEAVYYVKDNGVGFDMAHYDKLFVVFQRLHTTRQFPGTGVGLAIVQRVIVRHGGRIWATGKVDEGATFYFALPLARR